MMHDQLKDTNSKLDGQLRALQDANDGDQEGLINILKTQIEENNNLIATQEQQLEVDRVTRETLQKEVNILRPGASRQTELEDEVKVLKAEKDSLVKKANMVDHFQKKLELQNLQEKENATLREHIDVLQGNQKEFDKVHQDNEALNRTVTEYKAIFVKYESDVNELLERKRFYEDELREKEKKIETLNARQSADEAYVRDLEETLKTGNHTGFAPESPGGKGTLTLEEELAQSTDATPNYLLEISRLKAEVQLLKSGSAGTTNATLRIDLEEAERIRKRLDENLRLATEKHAVVQKQLEAVLTTSSDEKLVTAFEAAMKAGPLKVLTDNFYRDGAIAFTRKLNLETSQALTVTQAKFNEAQAELTNQHRELLAAKADCKSVLNDTKKKLTLE
jgi:protein HOOK3